MMLLLKIFLIVIVWLISVPEKSIVIAIDDQNGTVPELKMDAHFNRTRSLVDDIQAMSHSSIRPASANTTITVEVQIQMMDSIELEEQEQKMGCTGMLILSWKYNGLIWDPQTYGGIKLLTLPASNIWTPRLVVGNSAIEPHEIAFNMVDISHKGTITANIYRTFMTLCTLNLSHFPFDNQTCPIIIRSSIVSQNVKLNYTSPVNQPKVVFEDTQRSWFNVVVTEFKCNQTQAAVMLLVSAKRKHTYYVFSSILPCSLLIFIASLSFFSPPESGEQISLSITNFLAFVTYFMSFSNSFPKNMDIQTMPMFCYILIYSLVMSSVSVLSAILMSRARYKSKHECRMLFGCYGDLLKEEVDSKKAEVYRRSMNVRMKLFNSMLFLALVLGGVCLAGYALNDLYKTMPVTTFPNICNGNQ